LNCRSEHSGPCLLGQIAGHDHWTHPDQAASVGASHQAGVLENEGAYLLGGVSFGFDYRNRNATLFEDVFPPPKAQQRM
jgi:hypothetical protein